MSEVAKGPKQENPSDWSRKLEIAASVSSKSFRSVLSVEIIDFNFAFPNRTIKLILDDFWSILKFQRCSSNLSGFPRCAYGVRAEGGWSWKYKPEKSRPALFSDWISGNLMYFGKVVFAGLFPTFELSAVGNTGNTSRGSAFFWLNSGNLIHFRKVGAWLFPLLSCKFSSSPVKIMKFKDFLQKFDQKLRSLPRVLPRVLTFFRIWKFNFWEALLRLRIYSHWGDLSSEFF